MVYLILIIRALHEYSLLCCKLRLNETQPGLEAKKEEQGLSKDSAPRENVYGMELPIKYVVDNKLINYWKRLIFISILKEATTIY